MRDTDTQALNVERARRAFRSMMDEGLMGRGSFIHDDQWADAFAKAYREADEWPDRAWLVSHWVGHRCGYVDCRVTEIHEHGGGEPMREMTPAEQMAALFDGSDRPGEI